MLLSQFGRLTTIKIRAKHIVRIFAKKNPQSVISQDIRQLDFQELQKISDIDALAFGFPCNDFSVVGKQKGIDGIYGSLSY